MLVVMQADANPEQVARVIESIRAIDLTPHTLPGPTRTAIAITGNTGAVDARVLEVLPGVKECIRVTKPYKLASREMHKHDTTISFGMAGEPGASATGVSIGPKTFTVIAGPCSVENEAMVFQSAEFLLSRGVKLLRAGAFKPRTSPYAFQGMGTEGLAILKRVREKTGIGIVTELMDTEYADAVEEAADIIQIGTRNMQNFSLLKRVGRCRKPVLLKRGMSATLEEWLMAAEYVMAGGNYQVILCERGVRTFADHSRNTLDLSVIPPAKALSHLPVFVDPSHGVGVRRWIRPLCRAAKAVGAHGIIVEVHPNPPEAKSDKEQALTFEDFSQIARDLEQIPLDATVNA